MAILLARGPSLLILTLDVCESSVAETPLGEADWGRTGLLTGLPAVLVARVLITGQRLGPPVSTRKGPLIWRVGERLVSPDFFLEVERLVAASRRLFFPVLESLMVFFCFLRCPFLNMLEIIDRYVVGVVCILICVKI